MVTNNKIMVEKKKLPAPIYIDDDLTREEEIIDKKLRDAGKRLKKEGKTVRYRHQKIQVDRKLF